MAQVGIKRKDTKLPEELLKKEDVQALIKARIGVRDKAIVSILRESGVRIGDSWDEDKERSVRWVRSGIKEKVNSHIFMHSRATDLANNFTEAQMKEFFGWTTDSGMASVYVHLSGKRHRRSQAAQNSSMSSL